MKFGDIISSLSSAAPLFPGMPAGYNGVDFDLLRSGPDNADGIVAVTGGQSGGAMRVLAELAGFNGTTFDRIRSAADNADGLAPVTVGVLRQLAENLLFNGIGYDRARGNLDNITLFTLSSQAANGNSTDQTNFNGRGLKLVTNITGITGSGTPTLTVTIQGKDPVSGQYYTILTGAGITATGTQVLTVYPGIAVAANVSASDILPRTWRVAFTITGTTPGFSGSIACSVEN